MEKKYHNTSRIMSRSEISKNKLLNIKIPIPSLQEQENYICANIRLNTLIRQNTNQMFQNIRSIPEETQFIVPNLRLKINIEQEDN